jgi:RND superfamily putative drug exporter
MRSVGYAGLLIPLVSVAVAVTLLPIILLKLVPRLDWPHVRSDDRASRAWTRRAGLVVHHRRVAAAAALVVLGALVLAASTLKLGATSGNPNTLSQTGEAKAGLTALERSGIGAGVLSPTEILTRGTSPALVAQRLRPITGVQGAIAPTEAGWHTDELALVDVIAHTDSSSTVDRVRTAAHQRGADVRVGGIVAQNEDFINAVYGSAAVMIALIALLTFVLLARAFRSLLLPGKAVVLNVLSVAAWGVVTLVWQHGYGSEAIWGSPPPARFRPGCR